MVLEARSARTLADPKPFVWHNTAEEVITKVRRDGQAALAQAKSGRVTRKGASAPWAMARTSLAGFLFPGHHETRGNHWRCGHEPTNAVHSPSRRPDQRYAFGFAVTISFWNVSGDYEGSVSDSGDVTLTDAPVRLAWTPIIEIGSATVDEAQVVTVPVTVKCEEGEQDLHVDRGVQVALYQRNGNVVLRGYGSIYDEGPECDGRLHRVDVPVIYGLRDDYPLFDPGEALATAAVVLCTYRGPFTCTRVEEAAEIRIHP